MSNAQLIVLTVIAIGFLATVAGILALVALIAADLRDRRRGIGEPRPHIAPSDPMAPAGRIQVQHLSSRRAGLTDPTRHSFSVVESSIPPLVRLDDYRRGRMQ